MASSHFTAVPVADRFWQRVAKGVDCWLWTRGCYPSGYGKIAVGKRAFRAHRIAWELTRGPIPDGLFVLHACDNPPCVRPDHLFLGDRLDNARDALKKGRLMIPRLVATAEVVRVIRSEYRRGTAGPGRKAGSLRDLSIRYKISKRAVFEIVHRLSWRHL